MFVRIFKATTVIILIILLIRLAESRDFRAFLNSTKNTTPLSDSKQTLVTMESEKIDQPLSQKEKIGQQTSQEKITSNSTTNPYVQIKDEPSDTDESFKPSHSICSVSTGYKIGTFDTRFNISKAAFLNQIEESAKLWSDARGGQLFHYDENGPLTINLIYDERQARTEDVSYLALDIENAKQSAKKLEEEYQKEKIEYKNQGDQLTKDIDLFQEKQKAYTFKVEEYNKQGGAPANVYNAMMTELDQLKSEAKTLDDRQKTMIFFVESINKKVARYNEFIVYINSLIRKSNSLGARKFTEGKFTPRTNTIDIYQYNDTNKLKRVITHELGHVLGINHNSNIRSIMYAVNSATTTSLSKEDVSALESACSGN